MNEPDITCSLTSRGAPCLASGRPAAPSGRPTPTVPCYAYSPWTRFPVIGPALTVLVAIVSALALVSNANAFNDVNAELQIAAREQRLARAEAQRVARDQAARQAMQLAAANDARPATAGAHAQRAVNRTSEKNDPKGR